MPAMTDYMARLLRRTKAGILQLFGQAAKKEATSPDVKFVSELNMDIEMRQLQKQRQERQMEQEQKQEPKQRHEIELELNPVGGARMSTDNNNNNENENSNHNSSSSDDEVEYYCYNQQYGSRSTRVVDLNQKTLRPPVGFYCK